ncbi:ATP-binding protein [Pseudomonas sp. SCB32]|uniref:ATP-binding protein n=1 Tax=Pseudomonas sp. SCB32 TaxID=2653853 RepID=UPI001264463B|nr:ATP-binding protein [Pseudomonas sp. SCB32]
MSITTISIPRLNDDLWDYWQLRSIWQAVANAPRDHEIHFDFLKCDFLRPNAVVILGGMARILQSGGRRVCFLSNTMRAGVQANLVQNGFAHAMGASIAPWRGNAIPYQEFAAPDKERIVSSLREHWLGRGWISVSELLADAILGQIWELFSNAFEHSRSTVGVICCGQHFPNRRELLLSIADFGVGIPANVGAYLGGQPCAGDVAMRHAFSRGFTTTNGSVPRGMGLDLVKEFVQKANGCLEIFSHQGHARIDVRGEKYDNIAPIFHGTLVQIRLCCDDKFYLLSNELNEQPFF